MLFATGMQPLCLLLTLATLLGSAPPPAGRGVPTLPPVDEVQRRAVEHARLNLDEVASWKHRARLSAFVPRVQVEYANRLRNTVDVNVNDNVYVGSSGVVVGPEDGAYKNNFSDDHYVGVRAVWELHQAVFHPAQLGISSEQRNVMRDRNALLTEVGRHYFTVQSLPGAIAVLRRRLAVDPNPEKVRQELFVRGVACEESSAALDGLTGGWWRGQLDEATPPCQPPPPVKKKKKGMSP